jgi:DNA-binding response OmpR family regulator
VPTVLFLERNEELADALRAADCVVLEITEVSQAIAISSAFRPDAIVLGVAAGSSAGLLTAAMLKFDPATAEVPMVCLLEPNVDAAAARAAGCTSTLTKPVTRGQLVAAVEELVGGDPG